MVGLLGAASRMIMGSRFIGGTALIAGAGLIAVACGSGSQPAPNATMEAATSASAAAPSSSSPTSGATPADGASLPIAALFKDPYPGRPNAAEIPRLRLVRLLSERLGDGNSTIVQTVVCGGALAVSPGSSVQCTATVQSSSRSSDEVWTAYPAFNPDGSRAVVMVAGADFTPEFVNVIGAPGTSTFVQSAAPGTLPKISRAEDLRGTMQAALQKAGVKAEVRSCAEGLRFDTFKPVMCAVTVNGRAGRSVALSVMSTSGEIAIAYVTQEQAG